MKTEAFSCKREELAIAGEVYRPDREEGKLPAVIICHGFGGNYESNRHYAEAFAQTGYAAVIFDFCGGGIPSRSEGKTEEMSVLTEKEDLKAVIGAVSKLPYVDPENITLMGCSQGGFVCAMTAQELQEKVRRLILIYPALCIPDDSRRGQMILARFDPRNIPEIVDCGPMKLGRRYVTDVQHMNVYDEIREYRGPVLIVHGSEDELVPVSYSQEAYRQYLKTHGEIPGANCQLALIDGGNHGFWGPRQASWEKYVIFAIRKFLEGKTLLLNVDVRLQEGKEEQLADGGKRVELYFEGHSESGFFTGDVVTPAYDEQIFHGDEPDTCCADYIVEGTDYTGKPCKVHITNRMLPGKDRDWDTGWKPQVQTDSQALAWINALDCETYAEGREVGPHIHIWG